MPLQATSGAASYDAFGGGVPVVPAYIEEVFSTYLYTSTGSNQTITNGIDLSTKGGLVWVKGRNAVKDNVLVDTVRGVSNAIVSNTTDAQDFSSGNYVNAFSTTGFGVSGIGAVGGTNNTFATWTFRKQPKFFDVLTYTGNGAGPQVINHNLGSAPGCVIVKSVSNTSVWWVWHRGNGGSTDLTGIELNSSSASTFPNAGVASDFTATTFNAGSLINVALNLNPNVNGQTYVAYLFAHDAGGFGLTGLDNVISCGSYTGTGATGNTITLGYEPQWVMIKRASGGTADWRIYDVMRNVGQLEPNTSDAEAGDPLQNALAIQATGFGIVDYTSGSLNANGSTYIYIAIRRGPMKVPTSGTSVFSPNIATGNGTSNTLTTNFPVDLSVDQPRAGTGPAYWIDRLRGGTQYIDSANTTAETTHGSALIGFQSNTTLIDANYGSTTDSYVNWAFRRAPSFFDEVCYTGSSSTQTITHNLTVAPELIIVKKRTGGTARGWAVYPNDPLKRLILNSNVATSFDQSYWNDTAATSSVFTVASSDAVNGSGFTFVAYLFATCAGVSKVGSFTGNGSSQTINCGFTGGARFVLIKKSSGTGDWMVSDSARGIVSGNDPYLELNNTNAEVTSEDWLDTDSTGFVVNEVSGSNANTNGATYIFLAIA